MIISKNNNNSYENSLKQSNDFNKKLNILQEENKKMILNKNPYIEDIKTINHADPVSNKDMRTKSLAMLQERLDKGLITLEEFNRKCKALSKK